MFCYMSCHTQTSLLFFFLMTLFFLSKLQSVGKWGALERRCQTACSYDFGHLVPGVGVDDISANTNLFTVWFVTEDFWLCGVVGNGTGLFEHTTAQQSSSSILVFVYQFCISNQALVKAKSACQMKPLERQEWSYKPNADSGRECFNVIHYQYVIYVLI